MRKQQVKTDERDEAFDVPSLEKIMDEQYQYYFAFETLPLDHHDIIRSGIVGYPIAATSRQARIHVQYIQYLAEKM